MPAKPKPAPTRMPDLRREVEDFRDAYPALSSEDAFCAWFILAYLVERPEDAAKALTGVTNDKDVDAVLIDDTARRVFVIQSKYRQSLMGASETRAVVLSFAGLPAAITGDLSTFKEFANSVDPLVADRVRDARDRCIKRGYTLDLYFVTTGRFSPELSQAARTATHKSSSGKAHLTLFDGQRIIGVLDDYLDGIAPPVPSVELAIEAGNGTGIVDHFDHNSGIESWVFTAKGSDVGQLFIGAGTRIFARNVRGFLGSTAINTAMEATLANEPEHFLYFNNGVTIVCDDAVQEKSQGRSVLRISNPQIINGQQTTRMLARDSILSKRASVLVRVIRIPRGASGAAQDNAFDLLVSQIVEATNWQNQIRASDLMSNDRQQIAIERELRKLGYQYLRKRQTKGEARRAAGNRTAILVKKEEIAWAVAACELDPATVREGIETLFSERYYKQVFPSSDPHFYLARYWLMRKVTKHARGSLERSYARWVLLNFIWRDIGSDLEKRARLFEKVMERPRSYPAVVAEIDRMIERALLAAVKFYRSTSRTPDGRLDPNSFFQRQGRHHEFQKFWTSHTNPHRKIYETARGWFVAELQDVE